MKTHIGSLRYGALAAHFHPVPSLPRTETLYVQKHQDALQL
jgi:hypothetical protein